MLKIDRCYHVLVQNSQFAFGAIKIPFSKLGYKINPKKRNVGKILDIGIGSG